MTPYRFLALTDHRGHSKENSIYALLRTFARHERCQYIEVASRSNPHNASFFFDLQPKPLYVCRVDEDFEYQEDGMQFKHDNQVRNLTDYDVILMRLPRPVSGEFMQFLSDNARLQIIINDPKAIEETSSKAFLLNFPDLCPAMRLCHTPEEIWDFTRNFAIVLKPLKEYGGKGILKLEDGIIDDGHRQYDGMSFLEEMRKTLEDEGVLAMKYLSRVDEGDKRILVVGGDILAASLRLPSKGSWLCNVARGGIAVRTDLDEEERYMVDQISPPLMEKGILIFGADTLVDDDGKRVLSEINTLSIGGFQQAELQTGRPVLRQTVDKIISYVDGSLER